MSGFANSRKILARNPEKSSNGAVPAISTRIADALGCPVSSRPACLFEHLSPSTRDPLHSYTKARCALHKRGRVEHSVDANASAPQITHQVQCAPSEDWKSHVARYVFSQFDDRFFF